jgi:hypothetical protein
MVYVFHWLQHHPLGGCDPDIVMGIIMNFWKGSELNQLSYGLMISICMMSFSVLNRESSDVTQILLWELLNFWKGSELNQLQYGLMTSIV